MQAEVPTGKRHWTQQPQEDHSIPPLDTNRGSPTTMKDTVLDVNPDNVEPSHQTPPSQDEPDRQVDSVSPPSPAPSPRLKEKLEDNHHGSVPIGHPEALPTPDVNEAAPSAEGVPFDDELSPPLPDTAAPPSVGIDVTPGSDPPPPPATPIDVVAPPPIPEDLPRVADYPIGVDVVSGYDTEPIAQDATQTQLETPMPEMKGTLPNGIAKIAAVDVESGYANAAFVAEELEAVPAAVHDASGGIIAPKGDVPVTSVGAIDPSGNNADPCTDSALPGASPDGAAGDEPRRSSRRVSFSERPPQRAVYETAGAEEGAPPLPQDPAARAIKEQGLGPGEKWRILRNVALVSGAFMLLFTPFFGAANLQSTVNPEQGLGTISLTAVYAAIIVSNLFLPSVVIRWLGCKWTVACCMLAFTPYAAAQLAASWGSLVPTALLLGAAGGPMWCAKCSYLNAAAGAYSVVTGAPRDLVMVRFFGLFYVLFPLGHLWGNLITSEVLSTNSEEALQAAANATMALDVAAVCGANFCPAARSAEQNPNLARPPDAQIRTIGALFIALTLAAALLVAVGLDNLRRYGEGLGEGAAGEGGAHGAGEGAGGEGGSPPGGAGLLVATLRLLGDRNQLMLVPITAFIGISQAFLGADFTESYIACAWGIPYIGYVLMGYGLASSVASVVVSWAVKRAGRLPVVAASIALFLLLVAVLRWWTPRPAQGAAYVLFAAAWGLADSTALVINAMYGLLFRGREAAAYSNFSLWGSAGFIATYSYSPHLCAATKLAILAVILLLSLAGFIMAELALRKILAAEEERAKKREEILAGAGISVLRDKAHAA